MDHFIRKNSLAIDLLDHPIVETGPEGDTYLPDRNGIINGLPLKKPVPRVSYFSFASLGKQVALCFLFSWSSMMVQAVASSSVIKDPLADNDYDTFPCGISGGNVVGYYNGGNNGTPHGFLFNGSTYTDIDDPLADTANGFGTYALGVSGSSIVGFYHDGNGVNHGFLFNGGIYATIDDPLASNGSNTGTTASGISGDNIVGWYTDSNGVNHGFLYNGSAYATIDNPLGVNGTIVSGIDRGNLAGYYSNNNGNSTHGFIFDGKTYVTIDAPLGVGSTFVVGIYGGNVLGYYVDTNAITHGFLYSGGTFTAFDHPLAGYGTFPAGISGENIVGYYVGNAAGAHGFEASFTSATAQPGHAIYKSIGHQTFYGNGKITRITAKGFFVFDPDTARGTVIIGFTLNKLNLFSVVELQHYQVDYVTGPKGSIYMIIAKAESPGTQFSGTELETVFLRGKETSVTIDSQGSRFLPLVFAASARGISRDIQTGFAIADEVTGSYTLDINGSRASNLSESHDGAVNRLINYFIARGYTQFTAPPAN